ncbi:MAG: hydantoinase/oxoprolinase family protein, partial [Planctomycetota bacterium]
KQLVEDIKRFGDADALAVTMTGELADCFFDRRAGVQSIVQSVSEAAAALGIRSVAIYSVSGQWLQPQEAIEFPDQVAAANWHVMALWLATSGIVERPEDDDHSAPVLMIDVGSTTTDLIPIEPPKVLTQAKTDFDRLREGSLVYLGGRRTPICSLLDSLDFDEQRIPLMREVFATMDDARLLLGYCPEMPDEQETADGRPRDRRHAANRLARMIGLDHRQIQVEQATELAAQVHRAAVERLSEAISVLTERFRVRRYVVLGHAPDLVQLDDELDASNIDLRDLLGEDLSRVGPAYAAAQLAEASLGMHRR